jgi:hypothetical protein
MKAGGKYNIFHFEENKTWRYSETNYKLHIAPPEYFLQTRTTSSESSHEIANPKHCKRLIIRIADIE